MGKGEVCTGFWWGILEEREQLGDSDVDDKIMLRWIFCEKGVQLWTGSNRLKIGTGGGHLRMW
jgi:hypothetical protein